MPTRVVLVRRPRLPVFGAVWAFVGWLRSCFASLRRPVGTPRPGAATVSAPLLPEMPWLVWSSQTGTHRCVGCGRCIVLCPAEALVLECRDGETGVASVARFVLDPGRCIGCRLCAQGCPEDALRMAAAQSRVGAGGAAVSRPIVDLLRHDVREG